MAALARVLPVCRRALAPLAVPARFQAQLTAAAAAGAQQSGLAHHLAHDAQSRAAAGLAQHAAGAAELPTPPIRAAARAASAKRDPERPKKPPTAFIRFLDEYRKQRSGQPPKELMKAAGAEWRALPEARRKPFVEPYEAEKAKYEAAFKEYKDSGKLDAWKRDPERPKRPLTPLLAYAQEVRPQFQHLKMTEQTKAAAERWKALTPEQKRPYEERFAKASREYKEKLAAYQSSGKEAAWKAKTGAAPAGRAKGKAGHALAKAKAQAKAKAAQEQAKAKAKQLQKAKAKIQEALKKERLALKKAKEAQRATAAARKAMEKVKAARDSLIGRKTAAKAQAKAKAKAQAVSPKAKAKAEARA